MALSISKAWDETSAILKRDGKPIATVALALIALPFALMSLVAPSRPATMSEAAAANQPGLLSLLVMIVLLVATLAITAIALRPQTTVGQAIGDGARKILPMLGSWLLIWIPLFLLLVLLAVPIIGADADPAALEAGLASGNLPPSFLKFVLVCLVIGIIVGVKMILMTPVAIAETNSPVKIVTRSWALTRGHFFKLLGFVLLFMIAAMIALTAVIFVLGGIIVAIFSAPEPMSVSALFTGLLMGLCYAVIMVIYTVMAARIYAQVATPDPGVPNVDRG